MHKNIVLLSDGTGNSAAKPFKTNVWRLYQALDIAEPAGNEPRQIVYYDGGVGTENFKPLAALGGAFGLGVWTNVRDLYTFVCRNYDVGDQIYGFGFSRGAYTIRLLMGLIGKCGIISAKPETEAALQQAVQIAYEAFRRDFLLRASQQRRMIYHKILNKPCYDEPQDGTAARTINLRCAESSPVHQQLFPQIRFVGVWDTVDAYGMPIEEMKKAIDKWVWPMSFADRNLPKFVVCARHALSLDDERPTFRPVLWNERSKEPTQSVQQVWFAGVHANVGGGYADDGLAYLALDWMMAEAVQAKLRFWPGAHEEVQQLANAHGEQYDSRSGIAAYYRYGPRQVHQLCNDREHEVWVPTVNIHAGVFDRIAAHQVKYAPVSLNCAFNLVGGSPDKYPPDAFCRPDDAALIDAWRAVRLRRYAYFATVVLTIYLACFFLPHLGTVLAEVFRWLVKPLQPIPSYVVDWVIWPWMWVERAWSWLVSWLPDAALRAIEQAMQALALVALSPWTALVALGALTWLFFKKSGELQDEIAARAEWAWAAQKGLLAAPPRQPPAPMETLETARVYPGKTPRVIIDILGIAILALTIVPLGIVGLLRAAKPKPWLAKNATLPRP